ncbi:HAD-IIB family hydrolase [Schlegelella sp. S2-27]|uniref:HAD-IIB family hydrolase n=1 Tax=Caldimonas mangrovi TaxID=2944811 RepID=A0ABT0YIL1_9BURK|nr:HAD-IIB family hydrolase [Caldimonas mangrovi]MCM5678563.1 HAD-IIB family hydrolase [Caldimonas mangrovi]
MLPLAEWPLEARRAIRGVFTDIDDTLTTEGAITEDAVHALATLRDLGVIVVPITGRPMGWSQPFARSWPVAAIVPENGAMALLPDGRTLYMQDQATRSRNAARLAQVAQRVLDEVPGATLARDSAGRVTDIAVDHSEFAHLPPQRIEQIVALMRSEGMVATVSSIHINGWFGEHDKLSGARWVVRELYGRDLDAEIEQWVYVGDSTNDQLMFDHFANSIGVANIERFLPQLRHRPRYVTRGERGAGFAEVARALRDAKK